MSPGVHNPYLGHARTRNRLGVRHLKSVDYIIIGAGSAGCVLASRLSEDADVRVRVLEAGPMDRSLYVLRMPAAFSLPLQSDRYNWYYHSEPEPYLDGKSLYYPRGRVVGGSSSINGMVYFRGNALDYDGWAGNQLSQWSYAHCLPYFKRMETRDRGGDEFRGDSGPLEITTGGTLNPLYQAYIDAGVQAGYPFTKDVNGYQQEGVFVMERTTLGGKRNSAARAYLHPALQRPNLTLEVDALIDRIKFEGNRAVGVSYFRNGERVELRAEREVILCGGAFNSPQILQRSGVGNADELNVLGVEVVHNLPGVGENLQDHLDYFIQYECLKPVSLYPAVTPLGRLKTGLRWLFTHSGVGASNLFEAGAFLRTRPGVEFPNIQHHFLAVAMNYDGTLPAAGHGFQVHLSQMRPTSTGTVKLRSTDPREPPRILFNHLMTENDREEIRDGIRLTREIIAQDALAPYRGRELSPGPQARSDAELDAFARTYGETSHHPSCTCKMGYDDKAVVDGEAKVHGLQGLRVVDASIMPKVVTANLNAPTIMLAEKLSDVIRGREPLQPDYRSFYRAPDYETSQR